MSGHSSKTEELESLQQPTDAMTQAREHYLAGRLSGAEGICQQILDREPTRADALHLLGAIAHRSNRGDIAIELISRAAGLDPNNAEIYFNLGVARQFLGRHRRPCESYREALCPQPVASRDPQQPRLHSSGPGTIGRRPRVVW